MGWREENCWLVNWGFVDEGGRRVGRHTFSVIFWTVMPLVQRGRLLGGGGGWDGPEPEVDAGWRVEVFGCSIG